MFIEKYYVRNVEKLVYTPIKRSSNNGVTCYFIVWLPRYLFFGNLIAPLLIAIVLAYLLEMPIRFLNLRLRFPRIMATILVFGSFISIATIFF